MQEISDKIPSHRLGLDVETMAVFQRMRRLGMGGISVGMCLGSGLSEGRIRE